MSARAFTVLAPNGRRQIVKCNLNTTILQILEEVCKKQGFEPLEYDIKHHNKALDTSMTVQFSGLPNNAQLELGPASKTRAESEITIALNFENGERIFGTFAPSYTLKEVLETLDKSQKPNPVVIYMRRELYGDDLSRTDLRSLGLTGGRAMIRVIYRDPEELKTQANVSSIIPSKPVEEKPYKRVFQPLEPESQSETPTPVPIVKEENDGKILPTPKNVPFQPDIFKLAKERKKVADEKMDDEPIKSNKGRTLIKEGRKLNSKSETPMKIDENLQEEQSDVQKEQLENVKMEDFPFTGERRGLIFPLDSARSNIREESDDFFDLTLEDAKTILRDVRKMREEAEEGGPLLTAALRQLEESKKQLRQLNRYSKCIIRILFPDRTVLQGVFSSTDFVKSVQDFVKEHLADTNTSFYLYTAPPKSVLPEDKRLIEVDCVPGALLHFGTKEQFQSSVSFIREDLKEKFTTNSMASLAVVKIREEAKRNRADEVQAGCSKENDANKRNSNNSTEKVPKWFKGK